MHEGIYIYILDAHMHVYIYMYSTIIYFLDFVIFLAFSLNNRYLATGSFDCCVNLIDIRQHKILKKFEYIHFRIN